VALNMAHLIAVIAVLVRFSGFGRRHLSIVIGNASNLVGAQEHFDYSSGDADRAAQLKRGQTADESADD
jgi:hypothetical protein